MNITLRRNRDEDIPVLVIAVKERYRQKGIGGRLIDRLS